MKIVRSEQAGETIPEGAAGESALEAIDRGDRDVKATPETKVALQNRLNLLTVAGNVGRERAKGILGRLGYAFDDANIEMVLERAIEDTRKSLADQELDPRVELQKDLIAKYLPDEKERACLASGEMPLRQNEEREIMQWLNDVDVEQTYHDDLYYKQFFGQETGFTHLSRSKDGAEAKHEFIDRIVAEKEARLRGLKAVMRAIGLKRDVAGGLRLCSLDRSQEDGEPINSLLAHAFMVGMEKALSIKDPKQQEEASMSVMEDLYRYLGREDRQEIEVDPKDIISAEAIVAPRSEQGFPISTGASPMEAALQRAADEEWERQRRASLDLGDKVRRQRDEVERSRQVTGQPTESEVTFEPPTWVDGGVVGPDQRTTSERGPVVTPETVTAAQEAYDVQRAVAPERTRWGWIIERTKGMLTAGAAEFRHFFGYGSAARKESKAINEAYERFLANDVGITPDQRSGQIQTIVDDAELRMMKRLRNYTDEYGESVVSTGPEMDQFRARLQSRLEEAHDEQRRVDKKELRNLVLGSFDPKWHRRGIYGVIELALAASGVKLLINKWLAKPIVMPAAKTLAVTGIVTAGTPEILTHIAPPPDVAPMTKTIWHTIKGAWPDATAAQLKAACEEVMKETGKLFEPAWKKTMEHATDAWQSTRALVEGVPLKGILGPAVQKIMGV